MAKRTVLIVDDDKSFRNGLAALVGMQGHETLTAATVHEALERLEAGPSHLLLDMNLPDGPGPLILRHVRGERLPVKVAVLSGTADAGLIEEARSLRPDAVFSKPPEWDAVLEWIAGES